MTTLYASVLQLHALRDGMLDPSQGHHANAAFYSLVEQVDPDLAAQLHDAGGRKPFTLGLLHGLPPAREGVVRLRAGHSCWLRVTLAGERMFQTFITRFMVGNARPTIRLGDTEFGVAAVLTTPGSHPWAGYGGDDELLCRAQPADTITLEFASPLSFSLGNNKVELMPRPELLFGGLMKKWAEWCAQPLPATPDAFWLRQNLLVSRWDVRSQALHFGRQVQIGSTGTVTFSLFDADPPITRTLSALADFAFYAGAGRKTTQGMGQARRI